MNNTNSNNQYVKRNNKHTTKRKQQRKKKTRTLERFNRTHPVHMNPYMDDQHDHYNAVFKPSFFKIIQNGVKSYTKSMKEAVIARLPLALYQYIMFPVRSDDT
jgi:hypothetical protein